MRNTAFAFIFLAAAVLLPHGPAHSQPSPQPPQPPATVQQPAEAPPAPVSSVTVEDGRLSVELVDAEIGTVISEIAKKINCTVEINRMVYGKKITTKFSGLDIERGIERLLSLAQTTNYLIHYDAEGKLSSIELYADTPSSPSATSATTTPSGPTTPYRPLPGRRYRRYVPPQQNAPVPMQPPQPAMPPPQIIGQ